MKITKRDFLNLNAFLRSLYLQTITKLTAKSAEVEKLKAEIAEKEEAIKKLTDEVSSSSSSGGAQLNKSITEEHTTQTDATAADDSEKQRNAEVCARLVKSHHHLILDLLQL